MSLTFWNRRRREAAESGEGRDPQEVLAAAEATAGQPGTEGVEGHTGTDQTAPPLGAPEEAGQETDASGETHEVAADETDPQGAAEAASEVAPEVAAVEAQREPEATTPKGNASREEWAKFAAAHGHEVTESMTRDDLRALFA